MRSARRPAASTRLDAWTFNRSALEFYEAIGFHTFRQFMEWGLAEGP